jgi:hypothetical protein
VQAVLGGVFLGTGSGLLMLFSGKIAGNSGALKSIVLGEFDGVPLPLTRRSARVAGRPEHRKCAATARVSRSCL